MANKEITSFITDTCLVFLGLAAADLIFKAVDEYKTHIGRLNDLDLRVQVLNDHVTNRRWEEATKPRTRPLKTVKDEPEDSR